MAILSLDDILFPSGSISTEEQRRLLTLFPDNTVTEFFTLLEPSKIFTVSGTFSTIESDTSPTERDIPTIAVLLAQIQLSGLTIQTFSKTKSHLTRLIQLVADSIITNSATFNKTTLHPQVLSTISSALIDIPRKKLLIPSTITTASTADAIYNTTIYLAPSSISTASFARTGTNLHNHTIQTTSAGSALLVRTELLGSVVLHTTSFAIIGKSLEPSVIHTASSTSATLIVKYNLTILARTFSSGTVIHGAKRVALSTTLITNSAAFTGTKLRPSSGNFSTVSTTHAIGAIHKTIYPQHIFSTVSSVRFGSKLHPSSLSTVSATNTPNLRNIVRLFVQFRFGPLGTPFAISNSRWVISSASAVLVQSVHLSNKVFSTRSAASGGHILPEVTLRTTSSVFGALRQPRQLIPSTLHTTSAISVHPNNKISLSFTRSTVSNVPFAELTFLKQIFPSTISTVSAIVAPRIHLGVPFFAHSTTTSAAFGTHLTNHAQLTFSNIICISSGEITTMPTARLVQITGTLVDATGVPLSDQEIDASLDIDFTSTIVYDPAFLSVMPLQVSTTTANDGTWSLGVIAPEDLSSPDIGYIFSAEGFSATTGPFAYTSSPLPLTDILDDPAPNPEIVATIYGYVTSPSGLPQNNINVLVGLTQTATSMTTDDIIDASTILNTSTNQYGYWSLDVIPTTLLDPNTTRYTVVEGFGSPKIIAVTISGGNVNTLITNDIVAPLVPLTTSSIAADLVENDTTFTVIDQNSTLLTNMDNIRAILAKHSGTRWFDIFTYAIMSPLLAQIGSMNISGTADGESGLLTSGTLLAGTTTITGNLTLNGTTHFANQLPAGSTAVYTTTHGRQTLGAFRIFL